MTPRDRYERWLENCDDEALAADLAALDGENAEVIEELFSSQLTLGPDGIARPVGAGSSRLNPISCGRLVQAFAAELKAKAKHVVVAIAHDTHAEALPLAQACAGVLAANGIDCLMFEEATPLPLLSYAVRELACDGGIYVGGGVAPAGWCGLRFLSPSGGTLGERATDEVNEAARGLDELDDVRSIGMESARTLGRIRLVDGRILDEYVDAVCACGLQSPGDESCRLDVTLSTLNGSALKAMTSVFDRLSLGRISYVAEQTMADPAFATCDPPDPTSPTSLAHALDRCADASSDLLIACDPEGRRLSVAIRERASYRVLTDGELASLLCDYVCEMRASAGDLADGAVVYAGCATAPLAEALAGEHGVAVERCLPYAREGAARLGRLCERHEEDRFVLGFFGGGLYIAGAHCHEADAMAAAMLVCQMARHAKRRGTTLAEKLEWIAYAHGSRAERTLSIPLGSGRADAKGAEVLASLRSQPPATFAGTAIERIDDYLDESCPMGNLDMLGLALEDGSEVLIMPNGSAPTLDVRLTARAGSAEKAAERATSLEGAARFLIAGRM